MEGIKKAMNERNLNEGQWEDGKQWSLGVGQRRTAFCTYVHTLNVYTLLEFCNRHMHFSAYMCTTSTLLINLLRFPYV